MDERQKLNEREKQFLAFWLTVKSDKFEDGQTKAAMKEIIRKLPQFLV
ncbi:MAG: hypothetical protein MUD14_23070 [Hydrococcus sp. Prado102]|jgi:hypothetical protein|nr:hypothetical protein [Hydrococcus sp. Prado102]